MQLIPFDYSDAHYEIVRQIHDTIWPDNLLDMGNYRYWDGIRPKDRYFNRIIGFVDGTPVGYGGFAEAWWVDVPNYYNISWSTSPQFGRRGYATEFYDYARKKIAADGRTLSIIDTGTREDKPSAVNWFQKHGFEQKNRYPRSELKLDAFDPADFAKYPARAVDNGYAVKPLAEIIPDDPDWQRKVYELEWIFEQDEPTPIPPKKIPFEQYQKDTLQNPDFTPELWFVAVDGDRYAGMSCLWPDKMKPTKLNTGWTGVDRPYRRKGLAMAMKVAALSHAKQMEQVTVIETDNHETNWMFQINLRLGFQPIPAYLHFEKTLE